MSRHRAERSTAASQGEATDDQGPDRPPRRDHLDIASSSMKRGLAGLCPFRGLAQNDAERLGAAGFVPTLRDLGITEGLLDELWKRRPWRDQ